jgi:hypothetical protein
MPDKFVSYSCSDNDVIAIGKFLYKVADLQEVGTDLIVSSLDEIKEHCRGENIPFPSIDSNDLKRGADCEVLSPTSLGWKKGRVRFKFIVEVEIEPEDLVNTNIVTSPGFN